MTFPTPYLIFVCLWLGCLGGLFALSAASRGWGRAVLTGLTLALPLGYGLGKAGFLCFYLRPQLARWGIAALVLPRPDTFSFVSGCAGVTLALWLAARACGAKGLLNLFAPCGACMIAGLRSAEAWLGTSLEPTGAVEAVTDGYGFAASDGARLQVSRQGGILLWYLRQETPQTDRVTPEACREKAEKFAARVYGQAKTVWAQAGRHTAVINLTPTAGDAAVYADMIKIRLSLETGHILSVEASGYYRNAHPRDVPAAGLTAEQAQDKLNPAFKVESVMSALIPLDGDEVLCYEFRGRLDEAYYVVYLNAHTGETEDVYRVLDVAGTEMLV